MKVNKTKVIATIGALGLTAGVLAGCGGNQQQNDDYVKVVNSQGETVYISQDDYDDDHNGGGMGMFILFSSWNGHNHSKLHSSSGFKGKSFSSKPKVSSAKSSTKSGSGIGSKASSGKSGGFGG